MTEILDLDTKKDWNIFKKSINGASGFALLGGVKLIADELNVRKVEEDRSLDDFKDEI